MPSSPSRTGSMPRFDLVVATQDWHPADPRQLRVQPPRARAGRRRGPRRRPAGAVARPLRAEHARRVVPLGARRRAHRPRRAQGRRSRRSTATRRSSTTLHRRDTGLGEYLRVRERRRESWSWAWQPTTACCSPRSTRASSGFEVVVVDGRRASGQPRAVRRRARASTRCASWAAWSPRAPRSSVRAAGHPSGDALTADAERPPRGAGAAVVHVRGRGPGWRAVLRRGESSGEGGWCAGARTTRQGRPLRPVRNPISSPRWTGRTSG